ncbi:MAG: rhodanese-like domain-containing protein [Gammaproteobacteria bacterium]|nr:rhodanese-like domain-containing protein [Gammaproteobacteria bacterium]
MEQLPEFLLNHPVLTMAFLAIVGALMWTSVQARSSTVISPGDATRLINHENAVVVDVRGDNDYKQGHIVNAVHMPFEQLSHQTKKLERYKDRPLIMTCKNGQQGSAASRLLKKQGFESVYSLGGGLTAWEGASLPLSK